MIRFDQPLWLVLLALMPILAWLYDRHRREPAFLYSSVQLVKAITSLTGSQSGRLLPKMRWLALGFFIVALARPQLKEGFTLPSTSGVDTVVAVGVSKSMVSADMDWDGRRLQRLLVVRSALEEYLAWGGADRVGLVVFGNSSHVASPLTTHYGFLLDRLGQASSLGTEEVNGLGSALLTSLNRLRADAAHAKSVLVIADDSVNQSAPDLLQATGPARALRATIHGVVLGNESPGSPSAPAQSKTSSSSAPPNRSNSLQRLVQETGGLYGRATNGTALRALLKTVHERHAAGRARSREDAFRDVADWAMVPGLFLLLLEVILAHTVWRKLP